MNKVDIPGSVALTAGSGNGVLVSREIAGAVTVKA
jgi:hypothetical protein